MSRRVLITAGASGIGKEIAKAFYDLGDKVVVCDIDTKALQALAEEMPGIVTTACNIADRSDIEKMMAFGAQALGGYDILVNNAGIAGPTAPVEEMDPDEWEKVMQVTRMVKLKTIYCIKVRRHPLFQAAKPSILFWLGDGQKYND